jgi:hypothetical protein
VLKYNNTSEKNQTDKYNNENEGRNYFKIFFQGLHEDKTKKPPFKGGFVSWGNIVASQKI